MNFNDAAHCRITRPQASPYFLKIAQLHDVRATFWTFSSLPVIIMAGYVLVRVIQG